MRKAYCPQLRLDCQPIEQLQLNLNCRDEIVPLLEALKHVFGQAALRDQLTGLVARDVNETTRDDLGREGLDYWQVVVLAVVRLGCNLDYDKLQDLCENHRALRCLLVAGEWDETSFAARRLRDTLALLKPATIEKMNQLIVRHGQDLDGDARRKVRADSFVVETNIHYPAESTLILDGLRKIIPLCVKIASLLGEPGWRQAAHLQKKVKQCAREISRISASQSPKVKATLNQAYAKLLSRVAPLLERARTLHTKAQQAETGDLQTILLSADLQHWIALTCQVCDTAHRRTQLGEKVPNEEKLFSLFEPHTQLYRRGKAGQPNQFGRLALIYEDGAGFISHYHLMDRTAADSEVVVEQTRLAQQKHQGGIEEASFDRGFHSAENEQALQEIVAHPCLPPTHRNQYAECLETASARFHRSRQNHPGIESAVGALQRGNGLQRCRDRTEEGFERYLGFAILGRNMHVLGKLLIARQARGAPAAKTKRKAA
jgi:IS5 family transposase